MADYHHKKYVVFQFILFFSFFINISYGYNFVVGGRDGWVLNPSENYDKWAQRNRFQVNDTLLFKYQSGSDSVLVVNKNDHDTCHTGNPILKLTGGNSVFRFDRSGPFYFISGNKTHCDQGQKLIVVVLAVRNPPYPPPATGAPAPAISPPTAGAPVTWSPSPVTVPAGSPATGGPSPSTRAPSPATVPAVSPTNGAPSPSFWSQSPVTEAPSPSFWSQSPLTGAPSPAVSPGPPSPVTGAPSPGISGSGPSPAGSGNTSAPADGGSLRRSLAAPVATPSILIVSFVLSMAFGGFLVSN